MSKLKCKFCVWTTADELLPRYPDFELLKDHVRSQHREAYGKIQRWLGDTHPEGVKHENESHG